MDSTNRLWSRKATLPSVLFVLLLLGLAGCSDDGLFDLRPEHEPPPFVENGSLCTTTKSFWSCESDSGVEIDFVAYDDGNGGLFEADSTGSGLLVVRPAGGGETHATFNYNKPRRDRVDFRLEDGTLLIAGGVRGGRELDFLTFALSGGPFDRDPFECELASGFLDGDCDGEPGGERTPIPCEITFPSASPILIFCTPTPTATATPGDTATPRETAVPTVTPDT